MARPKQHPLKGHPLISSAPARKKPVEPGESSLLLQRIKELDREFARQTKQLTEMTKRLGRKLSKRR